MRRGPRGGPKHGMTIREIAEATGATFRETETIYTRAMRKLGKRPDARLVVGTLYAIAEECGPYIGCGSVECRKDFVAEWGEADA